MARIPACHAGDRGSIPRDGVTFMYSFSSKSQYISIYSDYPSRKMTSFYYFFHFQVRKMALNFYCTQASHMQIEDLQIHIH